MSKKNKPTPAPEPQTDNNSPEVAQGIPVEAPAMPAMQTYTIDFGGGNVLRGCQKLGQQNYGGGGEPRQDAVVPRVHADGAAEGLVLRDLPASMFTAE